MDALPPIPGPPPGLDAVAPAHDLAAWVAANVLDADGPLHNPDHRHLVDYDAVVGWLWMPDTLHKGGVRVLGRCAVGKPSGDAWAQAVREEQLERWFGDVPTFVVALDARHVAHALQHDRPADVLAVAEHELYHAGIDRDGYGVERFDRHGNPRWAVRPHDAEEFAGVILRYGVEASAAGPLVAAADHVRRHGPLVAPASLATAATGGGLCGTCARPIATA